MLFGGFEKASTLTLMSDEEYRPEKENRTELINSIEFDKGD